MVIRMGGLVRMSVAEVAGLEGLGEAFNSSIPLWKSVENFESRILETVVIRQLADRPVAGAKLKE
jgi:hypothetical protein